VNLGSSFAVGVDEGRGFPSRSPLRRREGARNRAFEAHRAGHRTGSGPHLLRAKLDNTVWELEGIAFAVLSRGDLVLRLAGGDCARLGMGDLLFVPTAARCHLDARRRAAEATLLEVPESFVQRASALTGRRRTAEAPRSVALARNGEAASRRAGDLLRGIAATPGVNERPISLRLAASVVELLAIAAEIDAAVPGSAPRVRSSMRREQFLAIVAAARNAPLDALSLPALARRLGLSERHASRLFLEYLDRSFRDWAGDLRLEHARRLLTETEMAVTEVAAETGWRSLAHFNARFKRLTGSTPAAYRRIFQIDRTEAEPGGAPERRRAKWKAAKELAESPPEMGEERSATHRCSDAEIPRFRNELRAPVPRSAQRSREFRSG